MIPPHPHPHLISQIQAAEGLRLQAYRCPAGRISIGYGHNLEAWPVPGVPARLGTEITREQAERLLVADVQAVEARLDRAYPWAAELSAPRRGALLEMAYNLGLAGLGGFARLLAAVQRGDWMRAACEMLSSRWAEQVGTRAERLARQMLSGHWGGGGDD